MSEDVSTKCAFVSVSRPHVTFHTLLGHSSFIRPSLPTFPSLFFLQFFLSETSDTPYIFVALSRSLAAARAQNTDKKDGGGGK